jgi:hypothetical protein
MIHLELLPLSRQCRTITNNLARESTTAGDLPTKEGMSGSTLASRRGLPPVSSAELLSCLSLSGGLLAQAAGLAWTNYSSHEWICLPSLPLPCGWHDRCPFAVTGLPPDGIAGCFRFCACHVCLGCGLWHGPSACALWRLLRWLCLNLIQIPSVFCDSFRIPLSYLLSSTLPCVLLLRKSPLHQPALFRHRQRP